MSAYSRLVKRVITSGLLVPQGMSPMAKNTAFTDLHRDRREWSLLILRGDSLRSVSTEGASAEIGLVYRSLNLDYKTLVS